MFTWDELERKYNMKLKQPPLRLSGGLMHKMYKLETDQGIYALKLLNPFIMLPQKFIKQSISFFQSVKIKLPVD